MMMFIPWPTFLIFVNIRERIFQPATHQVDIGDFSVRSSDPEKFSLLSFPTPGRKLSTLLCPFYYSLVGPGSYPWGEVDDM